MKCFKRLLASSLIAIIFSGVSLASSVAAGELDGGLGQIDILEQRSDGSEDDPLEDYASLMSFAPVVERQARAIPPVPGDTEVLSDVFRAPIGTGPLLLTDKILQITPARNSQNGAIWSKDKLDLERDFRLRAYLYLGDSADRAADGITFTLQNDGRMATPETEVLGDSGMGMGAYSNRAGNPYVRNAISIEFDTYYNNGTSNRMDREVGENGKRGHVAVVTPKSNNNNYSGEHSAVTLAPEYLSNGQWREIELSWKATSQTLSYDVAGVGSGSHVISSLTSQFGGTQVYWGFTASTGAFNAENVIAISELPQKLQNVATITNQTTLEGPKTEIQAVKGDQIELEAVITTSTFVDPAIYNDGTMTVAIPTGVTPDLENVKIDNQLVPQADLLFEDEKLIIQNIKLSNSGSTTFTVGSELTSDQHDVVLETAFTLADASMVTVSTSNKLFIQIPKAKIGDVLIQCVDQANNPIQAEKRLSGIVGTAYEAVAPKRAGYRWVETIGDSKGYFTEALQTVIFKYDEAHFDLHQQVTDADGNEANEAFTYDTLSYEVTLASLYDDAGANIVYKDAVLNEILPSYLENITDLSLETKSKQKIGVATYDAANHTITGKVEESDGVYRNEDIILRFKATVKGNTLGGTLIKVKANAEATYSDGIASGEVESNEVVTEIIGKIALVNAPAKIDFGSILITEFQKKVGVDKTNLTAPLIVEDNRKAKEAWAVTAQIEQEMTNDGDTYLGALKYVLNNEEVTLTESAKVIYANDGSSDDYHFNISNQWGKADAADGLKFKIDSDIAPKVTGSYEGIIRWTLRDTIE